MTDLSTVRAQLTEAAARILEAIGRLDPAWKALADNQPGYPSGHEGGSGRCSACRGSRTTMDDKPCEACDGTGRESRNTQPERWADLERDAAHNDRRNLAHAARVALAQSTAAYDIVVRWGTPPNERLRLETTDPTDWCNSCARAGIQNPRHRGDLCRWCYDFKAAERQFPPLDLLRARDRGERITQRMVSSSLQRQKAS